MRIHAVGTKMFACVCVSLKAINKMDMCESWQEKDQHERLRYR